MPCRSISGVKCFFLHSGSVSPFPEMGVFLNEICHAINCHIFRKLKLLFESKIMVQFCYFCGNRFLWSVATKSKDGNGVKFDNVGSMELFQILILSQQKSPKIILVSVP